MVMLMMLTRRPEGTWNITLVTITSRTALQPYQLSIRLELKAIFPLIKAAEHEFSNSYLMPKLGIRGVLPPHSIYNFRLLCMFPGTVLCLY
jgi:hypothetical protein